MWGLMFWAFIVYHKRKSSPLYPKQTKENLPLELVYTAVPFVMVSILFYFTVTTENYVLDTLPNPDVTVDVTAFKWAWDFGYEGTHVTGGGDEVHTVGTSDRGADPGVAGEPDHPVPLGVQGRRPLVLGAGLPVQA